MAFQVADAVPGPVIRGGGRLVADDGREATLRDLRLEATAQGGLARVTLTQRFSNGHPEPLVLTLHMALPADGAIAGYRIDLDQQRIVGRVEPRTAARRQFEAALLEGRLGSVLEEERPSVFMQSIGNLPPGADVVVTVLVDQPLAWLAEGAWEWRFPTVVAPRYLGAAGRVTDAERLTVDVAVAAEGPGLAFELRIGDALPEGKVPTSPSHDTQYDPGTRRVQNASGAGARPDRDVVVRWQVAGTTPRPELTVARPPEGAEGADAAYGLLTLVPAVTPPAPRPRNLVLVVDASGSMRGAPLAQAKRVLSAFIDGLGAADSVHLVAFADDTASWAATPQRVSPEARAAAHAWLGALEPAGGTEMVLGLTKALSTLQTDVDRQVVLVTDGLVGFEAEVVAAIRGAAAKGVRTHCLAIGPAVNRSLSSAVARVSGGSELIAGLDEPAGAVATRLLAHTAPPVLRNLSVQGSALREVALEPLPDLLAGMPARVSLRLDPRGGTLALTGTSPTGRFATEIIVPPTAPGTGPPAIATFFARERVAALELAVADGDEGSRDERIQQLGLDFQIATRLTTWLATSSAPVVTPGTRTRAEVVPQLLPAGLSIEGLGLRPAAPPGQLPISEEGLGLEGAAPQAMERRTPPWRALSWQVLLVIGLALLLLSRLPWIGDFVRRLLGIQ